MKTDCRIAPWIIISRPFFLFLLLLLFSAQRLVLLPFVFFSLLTDVLRVLEGHVVKDFYREPVEWMERGRRIFLASVGPGTVLCFVVVFFEGCGNDVHTDIQIHIPLYIFQFIFGAFVCVLTAEKIVFDFFRVEGRCGGVFFPV